jgi:hypothetical protein
VLPGVIFKERISPLWLINRRSLKSKNQPIVPFLRLAGFENTWLSGIRMLWHTLRLVESTNAIPVGLPLTV